MNKKHYLLLIFILCLTILFRFYNLSWGSPYFFHPDERNIASSLSQLKITDLNPRFFAYGSFPIYLIYLIFNFKSLIFNQWQQVPFEQAIMTLRVLSAVAGILTTLFIYKLSRIYLTEKWSLIVFVSAAFSPGLIQASHFGTFESLLALFYTTFLYFLINKKYFLSSLFLSLAIATRITSLIFLPILVLVFIFSCRKNHKNYMRYLLYLLLIPSLFLLTNPYIFLDYSAFRHSLNYESSVALGTLNVFYSQSFLGSTALWYQLIKIIPWIINPLAILALPAGLMGFFDLMFKNRKNLKKEPFFPVFIIILYSLFTLTLYVKWTRYVIPILPLFIFIIVWYFSQEGRIGKLLAKLFLFTQILWGLLFIFNTYFLPDSRVAASQWAQNNIPQESRILSETYDLGIVPFNTRFGKNITLYNFYDIDNNKTLEQWPVFIDTLKQVDYIIIPSERIINSRLNNPQSFPNGNKYYKKLLDGSLGFRKVYDSPSRKILFTPEETFFVFDRPRVMIFKNVRPQ